MIDRYIEIAERVRDNWHTIPNSNVCVCGWYVSELIRIIGNGNENRIKLNRKINSHDSLKK